MNSLDWTDICDSCRHLCDSFTGDGVPRPETQRSDRVLADQRTRRENLRSDMGGDEFDNVKTEQPLDKLQVPYSWFESEISSNLRVNSHSVSCFIAGVGIFAKMVEGYRERIFLMHFWTLPPKLYDHALSLSLFILKISFCSMLC